MNNIIDEIINYTMTFGFSLEQAEEHIQELLKRDELEEFYNNMYIE